jgi:hypothetical protein
VVAHFAGHLRAGGAVVPIFAPVVLILQYF